MNKVAEQKELLKLAAVAIKELQSKLDKVTEEHNILKLANNVAFDLLKNGKLAAEDVELYIKEASSKTEEELILIKEASALAAEEFDTFSVSNKTEFEYEDADLLAFILNS